MYQPFTTLLNELKNVLSAPRRVGWASARRAGCSQEGRL